MEKSTAVCIRCLLRPLEYLPQIHRCYFLTCSHKQNDQNFQIQYNFNIKIFLLAVLYSCLSIYVSYTYFKIVLIDNVFVGIPYKINLIVCIAGLLALSYSICLNVRHECYKYFIYTLNGMWQHGKVGNKENFLTRIKILKKVIFFLVFNYFCFLLFSISLNILGAYLTEMRYSYIQLILFIICSLGSSFFIEVFSIFTIVKSNLVDLKIKIRRDVLKKSKGAFAKNFKRHTESYFLFLMNLKCIENYIYFLVPFGYFLIIPISSASAFVILDVCVYNYLLPTHEVIIIPILAVSCLPVVALAIYFARLFDELNAIVSLNYYLY